MIPQWHKRMASGERLWNFEYVQFCDNPDFVNGTLGTKTVGVMGLGQIGGRMASWCNALGSRVLGYDPFISKSRLDELGVEGVEMDTLVDECEIVVVTIPPTPSATKILSRERIYRLRKGSLVVSPPAHTPSIWTHCGNALSPTNSPVHLTYMTTSQYQQTIYCAIGQCGPHPHIAGRTRDANLQVAEVIGDDFERILKGEAPHARLSREAIDVRGSRTDLPAMQS